MTCGSFLAILSDISTHFTRVINYMILCSHGLEGSNYIRQILKIEGAGEEHLG